MNYHHYINQFYGETYLGANYSHDQEYKSFISENHIQSLKQLIKVITEKSQHHDEIFQKLDQPVKDHIIARITPRDRLRAVADGYIDDFLLMFVNGDSNHGGLIKRDNKLYDVNHLGGIPIHDETDEKVKTRLLTGKVITETLIAKLMVILLIVALIVIIICSTYFREGFKLPKLT